MKRRMHIREVVCFLGVALCFLVGICSGIPTVSLLALPAGLCLLALLFLFVNHPQRNDEKKTDEESQVELAQARRTFLASWILGCDMRREEIFQKLAGVGIKVDESTRALPWEFHIDGYATHLAKHGIEYMRAVQQALCAACEVAFPDALWCAMREDSVIVLHFLSTLADEHASSASIQTIRSQLQTRYGITITIGLGTSTMSVHGVGEAVRNAYFAVRYRMVFGPGQTIGYDNIQMRIGNCPPYQKELEAAILESMRKGDTVKLEMAMSEFFEAVCAWSVNFIWPSVMRLLMSIYMLLPHAQQRQSDLSKVCADLERCEYYLEMLQLVKQYALDNMHPNDAIHKEDQSESVLLQIQAFVREHVGNPDIGLATIAENVGISAGIIRVLLKERMNTTPRDLIQSMRMQRAQELLRNTDLTAKAIGEAVGYRESRYFYNVFKKQTGMTTYEYRVWAASEENRRLNTSTMD